MFVCSSVVRVEPAILHRLAPPVRRALLTIARSSSPPRGSAQAHTLATAPTAVTAAVTGRAPATRSALAS